MKAKRRIQRRRILDARYASSGTDLITRQSPDPFRGVVAIGRAQVIDRNCSELSPRDLSL
jgi:hypothetical protein